MRQVLTLILVGCVVSGVAGYAQAPADRASVAENDALGGALWRLAVLTKTKIGFEALDHVRLPRRLESIPPLQVSSLEDGLNAVVGADGPYEWRRVGDVVVVRPRRGWDNPSNPFNRSTGRVHVRNYTSGQVLLGIRDFIYTNTFASSNPTVSGTPVSFELHAGTIVDGLNQLLVASDRVLWIAAYRALGTSERFPEWDLTLETRTARVRAEYSGSATPKSQ